MKKGNFEIEIINMENQIVSGLLSDNFGIYKDELKDKYTVTHLKTGGRIIDFVYQKEAREFVNEAEKIPGISGMDLNNCQDFREKIFDIVKKVLDK